MGKFSRIENTSFRNTYCYQMSCLHVLVTLISCGVAFYVGALEGMGVAQLCETTELIRPEGNGASKSTMDDAHIETIVNQRVDAELSKRLDKGTNNFAQGIVRVKKQDFIKKFDYGTPVNMGDGGDKDALLFYSSTNALPSRAEDAFKAQHDSSDGIALLNVTEATANCDILNVITIKDECTAIVGNYESHHIQRWMRRFKDGKISYTSPLQSVHRGRTNKGFTFRSPASSTSKMHWKALLKYFNHLDEVVAELKPIAESVAKKNTIIVMTCNMGQSELLMNFVCNARAKSLDISNILVFPTDEGTKELAEGLGLVTFYDKRNFEDLPEKEASHYGDSAFVAMMFAKVVCVQLTSMLGYDLLFQDVDIVWYRNPLDYFHNVSNPFYNFDMYFQDDGARSTRYAPTAANSGFYYVRNNDKTRYFFTSLLYSGDLILTWSSHQQALVQLMAEHSSLFGLRVKVLDREMDEFPGGWHYHRRTKNEYMKKVMKGGAAEIFHMSWTTNKNNKLKFFQQMGQWYLRQECVGKSKEAILDDNSSLSKSSLTDACCFANAEVTCHYRDKPSIIPCKESNPIDKGKPSFW